jgi:hypothetical protein
MRSALRHRRSAKPQRPRQFSFPSSVLSTSAFSQLEVTPLQCAPAQNQPIARSWRYAIVAVLSKVKGRRRSFSSFKSSIATTHSSNAVSPCGYVHLVETSTDLALQPGLKCHPISTENFLSPTSSSSFGRLKEEPKASAAMQTSTSSTTDGSGRRSRRGCSIGRGRRFSDGARNCNLVRLQSQRCSWEGCLFSILEFGNGSYSAQWTCSFLLARFNQLSLGDRTCPYSGTLC